MLLQTKEYIQNYGIYFTRKSMEHYSAFSLKCEQGQVEYPSIHHLLDLNSNYSSLRLASLILPVLEKSHAAQNYTSVCPVNLWIQRFNGIFLVQLLC